MTISTIAAMRASLKKSDQQVADNYSNFYEYWKQEIDDPVRVRFVEDKSDRPEFWVEATGTRVPFPNVKGGVWIASSYVKGKPSNCPLRATAQRLWAEGDRDGFRRWNPRKTYRAQAFVYSAETSDEKLYDLAITPFMQAIEGFIFDPETLASPADAAQGTDFHVIRTLQGGYNNYNASHFARRERALTGREKKVWADKAIALPDWQPPSNAENAMIEKIVQACLDGEPWSEYLGGGYYDKNGKRIINMEGGSSPFRPCLHAAATLINKVHYSQGRAS